MLVGGDLNPEDAVTFFAGYGLASEDTALDAEVTEADAVGVMSMLAQLMGLEWTADAAEEPVTRGDLAVLVGEFVNSLQG